VKKALAVRTENGIATQEKIKRIEEMYQDGKSMTQIAFYVSASLSAIEKIIKDNKITTNSPRPVPGNLLEVQSVSDMNAPVWKEERNMISNILSNYHDFTVISDLHAPYQNNKLLHDMCEQDTNKVLLTVGDLWHLDCASSFRKERVINFDKELGVVLDILEQLLKRYDKIVMLMANHERRYIHEAQYNLRPEMIETMRHNLLLSRRVASIFNGRVLETDCWWYKIGKAILAHPDWYTRAVGATVKHSWEYFMSIGETDFDCILNAHTHKCSKFVSMNKTLVEIPCVCNPQEYMNDGHRHNAEYYQGWTKFKTGKDGSVDFNDIDLHHWTGKK